MEGFSRGMGKRRSDRDPDEVYQRDGLGVYIYDIENDGLGVLSGSLEGAGFVALAPAGVVGS
jgi:hypothetical protein